MRMDGSGPFTRYSLAGWVFVVEALASLAFSGNQTPWRLLTASISAGASNPSSGFITAALGVVAGLSAPPAIGYVLTRAVAAPFERWKAYRGASQAEKSLRDYSCGEAERQAVFYSEASQSLIDWERARMTSVFASCSCLLAGISGVLFAGVVFGAWAGWVILISAVFAVLLLVDARYLDDQRSRVLKYWATHRDELRGGADRNS